MLGKIKLITSTYHLMIKFSTLIGIDEVRGDQNISRQYFILAMRTKSPSKSSAQSQLQIDDAEIEALRDEVEKINLEDP